MVDRLPAGFTYIKGTAMVGDLSIADPSSPSPGGLGPTLAFNLGAMPASKQLVLRYRVRVNVGAMQGDGINRARGQACGVPAGCVDAAFNPLGGAVATNEAAYRVKVSGGVFATEACVVGKIFVDCNHNHIQDREELGIPGVRLVMQDGTTLISDSEGKYSVCGIPAKSAVLKVDGLTLPRGSRLTTSSNRNLGDANSLWLDLKNGELHRADFIEGSCSNPVLEQVKARRAQGEVRAPETEKPNRPAAAFRQQAEGHRSKAPMGRTRRCRNRVRLQPLKAEAPVARTDRVRMAIRMPIRVRCTPLTLTALALAVQLSAQAQAQPPAGSPTDVRYTASTAGAAALYPRAPEADAKPPTLFRGEQAGVKYAANEAVARVLVEVDRDAVPADGQTPVKLKVQLFGRDGQPLQQTVFVTIEHSGGRVLLPGARTDELGPRRQDADKVTPGVQLKVEGGLAEFTLLARAEAQDVRVRITAGHEEAAGVISFVPELRPMVAAGLIEGIVNFRSQGCAEPAAPQRRFRAGTGNWARQFNGGRNTVAGRAAFYLKGTIRGDLLLTAAYDSDKVTRARLLRDVRPDEIYPVYGDASLRSFDARSGDRLYVRVDQNKSYALYGDFVTGDGHAQASARARLRPSSSAAWATTTARRRACACTTKPAR